MATEKRLIDANFLDDRCRRQIADEWNKKVAPVSWSEAYKEFLDDVWDAPTVDAVEVVHGRWEDDHCTNCNTEFTVNINGEDVKITDMKSNYCPNCGAKMDL